MSHGRDAWHRCLGLLVLFAQPELVDAAAVLIDQETDTIAQAVLVDEEQSSLVDLIVCHHPQNLQIGALFQGLPQLDEPRLGEGSPVQAAFESEQHPMPTQLGQAEGCAGQIR